MKYIFLNILVLFVFFSTTIFSQEIKKDETYYKEKYDSTITAGNGIDAIPLLNSLISLDSTNINYRLDKTEILIGLGKINVAEEELKKAKNINAKHPRIYLLSAAINISKMNLGNALKNINKSISYDSNYVAAYFIRSNINMLKQDLNAAKKDLKKVLILEPNNINALLAIGSMKMQNMEIDSAKSYFDSALKIDSTNSYSYYMRGLLNHTLGEYKLAILDYSKSFELNSSNYEAILKRGNCKYLMNDFVGAYKDISLFLSKNPNSFDAKSKLLSIQKKLNEQGLQPKDIIDIINIDNYPINSDYEIHQVTGSIITINSKEDESLKLLLLDQNHKYLTTLSSELKRGSAISIAKIINNSNIKLTKGKYILALIGQHGRAEIDYQY